MNQTAASARAVRAFSPSYDFSDWRENAACRGVDLDVFYPSTTGPGQYDQARTYCASCPVRDDCLEDAVRRRDFEGFRGGKTPRQRQDIRLRSRGCEVCRRVFDKPANHRSRYCSDSCRNKARRAAVLRYRLSKLRANGADPFEVSA